MHFYSCYIEKFYAIKTPLDGNYLNHLAPANYWTPKMALKCFKNLNVSINFICILHTHTHAHISGTRVFSLCEMLNS